jgi:protein CpxP
MTLSLRQAMFAAAAIGLVLPSQGGFTAAGAAPSTGSQVEARPADGHGNGHDKAASIEQRIKEMHAKLLVSPAQQPQWDAFADVMRNNGRDMEQTFHQRMSSISKMTAPENMQSYAQVATNHAQDMQKLVPAFQTLYDSMTDSQKNTADQVFRDQAHRGKHGHHG